MPDGLTWDQLSDTPPAPVPTGEVKTPSWDELSSKPPPGVVVPGESARQPSGLQAGRPWWERAYDAGKDALLEYSPMAALGRALGTYDPTLMSPDEQRDYSGTVERNAAELAAKSRANRQAIAQREAADPAWRSGASLMSNLGREAATFGGGAVGGAMGDPTTLIAPGDTILERMLAQGLVGSGTDLALQNVEKAQGVRDQIDPWQVALDAAGGAGIVGLAHGAGHLWSRMRGGRVAPGIEPDLHDVTLDGMPGGPGAPDVRSTLATVGMTPEQFSSPELAAAMADRVAAARARVPNVPPQTLNEHAALNDAIANGETNPAFAPTPPAPQAIPEGVTLTAHPEGAVRSDELGSIIGLMRQLAGNQNVLEQAAGRAAENPTLKAILDAQTSTQAKIGPLWDRLVQMEREAGREPPPVPHTQPTVEQARGEGQGVTLPVEGRISSKFGQRKAPIAGASTNHEGVDIAAPAGSDVRAPSGGTVVMAGEAGPNGNLVRIDHGNGVVSSYAHLERIGVKIGQTVKPGDVIGNVGATGRATGPHLHYAVRDNGKWVDPTTFKYATPEPQQPTWRVGDQGNDVFDQAHGPAERTSRPTSPTNKQMAEGQVPPGYTSPMGTSGNRPFKDVAPEQDRPEFRAPEGEAQPPEGTPPRSGTSYFEDVNQQQQDELVREYEASRARRQEEQARSRARQADPSEQYGKYGQKPHQEGDTWRMTDEGFVADQDGNPVAFKNAREAAKWATANKMAGDFELHTWGTNSERVTLKRRANSTYGEAPPRPEGPQEPAAGRSTDESQRAIEGPRPEDSSPPDASSSSGVSSPDLRAGAAPAPSSGTTFDKAVAEASAPDAANMDPQQRADLEEYLQHVAESPLTPEHGQRAKEALDKLRTPAEPAPKPEAQSATPAPTDRDLGRATLLAGKRLPRDIPTRDAWTWKNAFADGYTGRLPEAPAGYSDLQRSAYEAGRAERAPRTETNHQVVTEPVKPTRPPLQGKSETVVTPSGREVPVQHEVRELSDVRQAKGEMQPRDRSRDASDVQVNDIASKLDPEQLHANRQAAHGAPIITDEGQLATGNGRAQAIERAYEKYPERAAAYRKMIEDQGFDTKGFKRPILVRRMKEKMAPEDMRSFVNEAQDSGTMRYSAPEQARADAGALSDETVQRYRGGDVNSAGNRDFVKAWMEETRADKNTMLAKDGSLSAEGQQRIRASVLSKAFDDPTLVGKLLGDEDNNIKAIGVALTDLAPKFAQVKALAKDGRIPGEFDISDKVAEMAGLISRARSEGKKLADLIGQTDMFKGDVDPTTESLVRLMFKDDELTKPRSGVRLKEGFDFYLEGAKRTEEGPGMFSGEDVPDLKPIDILEAARTKLDAKDNPPGQGSMFKVVSDGGKGSAAGGDRSLPNELKRLRGDADPEQRDLIDRLVDAVDPNSRLKYGELGKTEGGRLAGQADVGENRVYVARQGDLETAMHEAVHLALIKRYGEEFSDLRAEDLGAGPAIDLVRLYNDARKRYGNYGFWNRKAAGHTVGYALSNVDEFVAEALSSPKFQRWLQRGTIWNRLVDGFRKALGLPARFKPMLEDAMRAGKQLLESVAKDNAGEVRPGAIFGRKGLANKIIDTNGLSRDAQAIKDAVGDPGKAIKAIFRPVKDGLSWLTFSADSRGRAVADRINSKAAHELLDHFFAPPGKMDGVTTGRTYHEAVTHYGTGRSQQAFRAIEPIMDDEAAQKRVAELLRFPNRKTRATAQELEIAKEVRGLLKDAIDYRKAAGENIGEVADGYFPRWLDVEKVIANQDDWVRRVTKLYKGEGVDDPEGAARGWLNHVVDTYAGLDGGLDIRRATGDAIGSMTANSRTFGKAADQELADYYQHDLLQVLSQYFHGAARRAEQARRFGMKGPVGSAERTAWEREHGGKTQLEVLTDRIRDDARTAGADAKGVMGVLQGVYSANLGHVGAMSRGIRNAVAWAHTWTQLGVMDHVAATSLGENMMGFVRGGMRHGIPYLRDSLRYFYRELKRATPDEVERMGEAIGVVEDSIVNEALMRRAGIEGGTPRSQKLLSAFYRAILLHQLTMGQRKAAVRMSQELIRQWSHELVSPVARKASRARKFLAEAGVKNIDAMAEKVRGGGFDVREVGRDASPEAADYGTAVLRIVEQSNMRPTRAQKPVWAGHPVGSMMFSLLSYNFALKKQVLDRAGRMAVAAIRDKDPTLLQPAIGLTLLGAYQYLYQEYGRPAVFGGKPLTETAGDSPLEVGIQVADRAGIDGGASPLVNAIYGVKYDRSLSESLLGPVLGRPLDMGTKLIQLKTSNSAHTNTAERNAAGAVYDNVLEPAMDGLAAARLIGPARSAAVLATGNRKGGVLPADRDAFIDAVAGPERHKRHHRKGG